MLQIYNYYQGLSTAERTHRCTAHKRSELKNIYQSIAKLSAKESLYKLDLSADQQNYAVGIKETSLSVQDALADLADPSVFQLLAAVSDTPEAITAKLLPAQNQEQETFLVEVKQLSSPQENTGSFLPASKSSLAAGAYSFSITIDNAEHSFRFQLAQDTANFDLQNKLADFINRTNIGIHADICYNETAGLSRLSLKGERAGITTGSVFELEDTMAPSLKEDGVGLLSYLGLYDSEKPAQNTVVSINGESFSFPEREYTYENKVTLSFLETTEEPVQIRITTDAGPVLEKLTAFTDTYNRLINRTRSFREQNHRSQKLLYEFSHFAAQHQTDLQKAGLVLTEEGLLKVDSKTAAESIMSQNLQELFQKDSAFTNALHARTRTVSLNPMDYIDKLIVVYPNTLSKTSVNPYITSLYSGMLFNNYC